jgi:uracil-DNA glycosylase
MKILVFLQNPWFPPGTAKQHIDRYTTDQEFHRRLLAGTMTGQRLRQAFGETMFRDIWWDNVAPAAAEVSTGVTEIDEEHVERVIKQVKPDLIISFGKLAEDALDGSIAAEPIPYMCCHHPNARHKTTQDLCEFAVEVQQSIERLKQ